MNAKEEYVDAPRETRSKDITVYAIISLILLVGAGIFLAVRLLHKPADAALADSKSGIVYDSSAVEGGWDNLSPEEIEAGKAGAHAGLGTGRRKKNAAARQGAGEKCSFTFPGRLYIINTVYIEI